jgi:hypothetical protein
LESKKVDNFVEEIEIGQVKVKFTATTDIHTSKLSKMSDHEAEVRKLHQKGREVYDFLEYQQSLSDET